MTSLDGQRDSFSFLLSSDGYLVRRRSLSLQRSKLAFVTSRKMPNATLLHHAHADHHAPGARDLHAEVLKEGPHAFNHVVYNGVEPLLRPFECSHEAISALLRGRGLSQLCLILFVQPI